MERIVSDGHIPRSSPYPSGGWCPQRSCPPDVLDEADWITRERMHDKRVDDFLQAHRAGPGETHPVWDFLFTYYSLRPRQLRRWHPGFGVVLGGEAARFLNRSGYGRQRGGVTVTREYLVARAETVRFVARLLRRDRLASSPAELLRTARVGDGVPGADGAARAGPAASRLR